jgi:hypothetical protein
MTKKHIGFKRVIDVLQAGGSFKMFDASKDHVLYALYDPSRNLIGNFTSTTRYAVRKRIKLAVSLDHHYRKVA